MVSVFMCSSNKFFPLITRLRYPSWCVTMDKGFVQQSAGTVKGSLIKWAVCFSFQNGSVGKGDKELTV